MTALDQPLSQTLKNEVRMDNYVVVQARGLTEPLSNAWVSMHSLVPTL